MPSTRKKKSNARSSPYAGIPLDPNYTGVDPQFGNISDLPAGVKRQTAIMTLQENNTSAGPGAINNKQWARLVFRFPECVGIAETLNNAAKKFDGDCIPTLSMNVKILVPVVKSFRVEWLKPPPDYDLTPATFNWKGRDYATVFAKANETAFILTGDDQLTTKLPDMEDETKTKDLHDIEAIASVSNAIYAKYTTVPDLPLTVPEAAKALAYDGQGREAGAFETVPQTGTADAYQKNVYYNYVAAQFVNPQLQSTGSLQREIVINNIQDKGHTLTSDHVNLFIKNTYDNNKKQADQTGLWPDMWSKRDWTIRTILDYTTKEVTLSSLLIWKRQLKEFLPKQVQWRAWAVDQSATANGWEIALSRGSIKENGIGDDPSSKTDFPDIPEKKRAADDADDDVV